MTASCLSTSGGEVLVAVRVTSRSPRLKLDRPRDGRLIVRVNAPPVQGSANKAVCKLLAKQFGVAPSRTRIVRGETARDKLVALAGVSLEDAARVVAELTS
ncbi:MAG: DUF167 domain-containing protein [Thermoleophilia bacterium]|nr:DUF167 domain-containing protein [Thermoleophilia bacterium]